LDAGPLPPVEQMIVAARESSEKLGELLERCQPFLTLNARYGLPEEMARCLGASDLVQETMMDAVRGFGKFKGRTEPEFSKWIKVIQAHNLLDLVRKHRRQVARERPLWEAEASASLSWREPVAEQSSPSQRVIRGENALRLWPDWSPRGLRPSTTRANAKTVSRTSSPSSSKDVFSRTC